MLPKLSVTWTSCGTLLNVSEMSPELLLATTSAAPSPVTEMAPKLSWSRVLPVTPAAWMSPVLLSSWMRPDRPEAAMVPKPSVTCTVPDSWDTLMSPLVSARATVPYSPRASRSPSALLTRTGSPAGTVMPRSSEQVPAGTWHWGLRASPSGPDR